jgi:hypothetical protein
MKKFFLILSSLLLSSCIVVGDFGAYADKTITDARVLGNWNLVSNMGQPVPESKHPPGGDFEITEVSGAYKVSQRINKSAPDTWYWLFKIGQYYFVTSSNPHSKCGGNCQLFMVDISDNALTGYVPTPNVNDYIESRYKNVSTVQFSDKQLVLTVLDDNTAAILVDLAGHKEFWQPAQQYQRAPAASANAATPVDPAIKDLTEKAEHGDAAAQFELGYKYHEGEGVFTDYDGALQWFKKAAAQNYAKADYALGLMYIGDQAKYHDSAEGLAWLTKAADLGAAPAQDLLAIFYTSGVVAGNLIKIDYAKALDLYRKAADRGYPPAYMGLANMYFSGLGVTADRNEYKKWSDKYAQQTNKQPMNAGIDYADFKVFKAQDSNAESWWSQSSLPSPKQTP